MSTVQGGQGNIVTSGLILNLDAANPRSYLPPYNGTTWFNLASGSNNGALTNGPTYNTGSGGSIVFDGTNDYVQINNVTAASFTLNCWVNSTSVGSSSPGQPAYLGSGIIWSDVSGAGNDFVLAMTGNVAAWFTGNPDVSINDNTPINTGAWFYLSATKDGPSGIKSLYINGQLRVTGSCNANVLNANSKINIGGNTLDSRYYNGRIAQVLIYNKTLTASEINQNFQATRARFGI